MRKIDYKEYFASINIPNNWDTLDSFIDWYLENRMPIMVPTNTEVIVTDNATAIIVFRHNRFQIELYIIHPSTSIVEHSHTGLDLAIMQIGSTNNIDAWGSITNELKSGDTHGGDNPDPFNSGTGYLFLTFQKWHDNIPMTSAAVQWDGPTHGPIQDSLVKRHKNCCNSL